MQMRCTCQRLPDFYLPIFIFISYSLFDMDGTLVDSTQGVKGAWNLFQETYPTIDVNYLLNCEHLYFHTLLFYFWIFPIQRAMVFALSRISEIIVASKIQRFSKWVLI